MIDRFLHDLIQKEFHIGKQKVDFIDCLLAVCATLFGIVIRFALNGTNGMVLSNVGLTVQTVLAVLIAAVSSVFVVRQTKNIKRGLVCYTVLLFLPTMLLAGMTAEQTNFWAASDAGLLSMAYPNIFQLMGVDIFVEGYAKAAYAFTAALVLMIVFFLLCCRTVTEEREEGRENKKSDTGKKSNQSNQSKQGNQIDKTDKTNKTGYWLRVILLLFMILTYFLPYMQYGNGLIIDVLFVIIACSGFGGEKRAWMRAVVQTAVSFGAYTYGMTGASEVPFYLFSFLELFLLVDLGMEVLRDGMSREDGMSYEDGNSCEDGKSCGDGMSSKEDSNAAGNRQSATYAQVSGGCREGQISAVRGTHGQTIQEKEGQECHRQEHHRQNVFIVVFLLCISVLAFFIRFALKDSLSMDYLTCLKPWVDEFKATGSFRAIAGDFYNYTPTYMYILYFISLLPCEPLIPIKLVSCLFDVILAVLGYRIIKKLTKSRVRAALSYGVILCLPTVAINSGMWGQCDAIYVTCIVASLYLLYENKSHASLLLYGMAFALKLQALFVFPFYVLLWVHKKYKIGQFLYLPFVYLLTCIPSAFAGKSIKELLLVYVSQGNTEPWMLSWNWPNIYLLFGPTNFYETYKTAGILGTLAVIMLLLYYMVKKWDTIDNQKILEGMLIFALVVPYTLPYMHERYGYLADILMVLYAFVNPKKLYLAVLQILLSFTAYLGYLHGGSVVPQIYYCFAMVYLLAAVLSLQTHSS